MVTLQKKKKTKKKKEEEEEEEKKSHNSQGKVPQPFMNLQIQFFQKLRVMRNKKKNGLSNQSLNNSLQ